MITEQNQCQATILLVDDTPGAIGIVQAALAEAGYDVAVATSGETALQRAVMVMPDLILLDVVMPGMDGYETCRRLKGQEATRNIPVIFLSALTETFDKVKGFGLGAVDYLIKPVASEELLARVQTHVKISRLEQQLRAANHSLEQRVAARTVELSDANARLMAEIEQRKQTGEALRQSETRFRAIFDAAFQFIAILTTDGTLLQANRTSLQFAGADAKAVLGKPVWETPWWTHSAELQLRLRTAIQKAAASQFVRFEATHLARDGQLSYVDFSLKPVADTEGHVVQLIAEGRDITERKVAEEEIRMLNQQLEQRVVQRTAALEQANKELETFSYSVSHDLRAPLRAITGFSRILQEEHKDSLNPDGQRFLDLVHQGATRMGRLIDDILAFSRMASTRMDTELVDMATLAHEVYAELQAGVPDRKIRFVLDALPPAMGDRAMLRQVWSNLLGNAVKYTAGREEARIEVSGAVQGHELVYCVKDNGAGFNMQYAGKLFGVFQRLHSSEQFEGTGIGLAIVQRIISRHGGRVWAEGKVNEGATFHFTLPCPTK